MNKYFKILTLAIFMFVLLVKTGFSQYEQYRFRHLNTDLGLSSNEVNVIFKDSKGFIWIGTNDGLNRFDGYSIKTFRNNPEDSFSINDNRIFSIEEQINGDLLLGTYAGGLIRYNYTKENFAQIHLHILNSEESITPEIYLIERDSGDIYWIGSDAGLGIYNASEETYMNYVPDPADSTHSSSRVHTVLKENKHRVWVGTDNGLFHFDPANESFTRIPLTPGWYYNKPFEKIIHCIYRDSHGVIWVGTHWFLYRYNNNSFEWIGPGGYYVDNSAPNSMAINAIAEQIVNGKQILWLATWGGVNRYDVEEKYFQHIFTEANNPESLSSYALSTQYLDPSGLLWIGHVKKGVDILNLQANDFVTPLIHEKATGLAALSFLVDSEGYFWAGMDDHGLLKMNQDMDFMSYYRFRLPGGKELQNCDIHKIFEDSRGNLWMGNSLLMEGLYIFNRNKEYFEPVDINIQNANGDNIQGPLFFYSILEDRNGYVWFGSSHGLFRNRKDDPRRIDHVLFTRKDSLVTVAVLSLMEDRKGNFWIATKKDGLLGIPGTDDELKYQLNWEISRLKHLRFNGNIYAVFEDSPGNIWLGTSIGLFKSGMQEDSLRCFLVNDEVIGENPVYGIAGDRYDNLWLNAQPGLIRFNTNSENNIITRKFTKANGLSFDHFSTQAFYQAPDGKIFIGGVPATGEGFLYFYPDKIKDNTSIPPVVLTDFKVRNEPLALDSGLSTKKHITLKYFQNFFSFEFAALDYLDPERSSYAYYLEGLDDGWIYSGGRRFVSYSSVPPGEYVFRVKGSNSDGYWNETGTAVAITILLPPWKTWWAYLCYALLLAGLAILFRSYDLRRIRLKQQLEIEHLEAAKLKELDTLKSRFFANISHEFRTPLTLVLGPLDKIREQVSGEIKRDMDIMKRNAQRLQLLINQLLMLSKVESGQLKLNTRETNIVKLVNTCVQSFESFAKKKNIEINYKYDEPEILLYVDWEKMEKILYNLLSNAFKFTPSSGRVAVKVSIQQPVPKSQAISGSAVISITDTGPGIAPQDLSHIFDRFYQADNADTILQEGTGIGLALTKELVELHHGKISIESKMGAGTTFTIKLLTGKSHLKEEEIVSKENINNENDADESLIINEQVPGSYPDTKEKTGKRKYNKIDKGRSKPVLLLVEDNADLREYLRGFLLQDYHLLESGDGFEGWNVATKEIPDLVLSDVMMPRMDGLELCDKLKNDERTSHIPIILLTALAGKENKLDGLKTGADDFVTKPFDPAELQVRISNLLEQRRRIKENLMRRIEKTGLISQLIFQDEELESADEKFMKKVIEVISTNMSDPDFNVEQLSSRMAMSHMQLHRKLVAVTGQTASRLIRSFRLIKAAELLRNKSGNVSEIAFAVGFNNLSWFAKCFHEHFGKNPSEYLLNPNSE